MVLCYVLAETIPVVSTEKAYEYIDLLESTSRHMSFLIWSAAAEAFRCCLLATDAPTESRLRAADLAVARLVDIGYLAPWCYLIEKLALAYLRYGDEKRADDCITRAIERCESTGEKWIYPQLCQIKARALVSRLPGTALLWLAKGWDVARVQQARQMEANIRDEIALLVGVEDRSSQKAAWESSLILTGRLAIPTTSATVPTDVPIPI